MRSCRALVALLMLAVLAATAAACSSGPSSGSTAPSATAGTTRYPLTITQPDGTKAVIRSAPTRVITVDNPQETLDDLAALGVTPVGAMLYPAGTEGFDARGVPTELSAQIKSITSVGTAPNKPDLERIVALHPDLIVGVDGASIADLKQLEAIAPVVSAAAPAAGSTGVDALEWVPQLRLLGQVLDRQAQADAFIARFEAAAGPVRRAVAGKTVDLVIPAPNGSTFTLIGATFQPAGALLSYVGLELPTSFPAEVTVLGGTHATVSLEHADLLTAQYLVLAHVVSSSTAVYATFLADPVVARLASVQAGRVIQTRGDESFGDGYLTAGAVGQLDALAGIQRAFTSTGTPPA